LEARPSIVCYIVDGIRFLGTGAASNGTPHAASRLESEDTMARIEAHVDADLSRFDAQLEVWSKEIDDLKVVEGLGKGLTEAAKAALAKCRFSVGEKDGVKVAVRVRGFKIRVVLRDSP
jgi:hypothetical protein